MEKTIVTAICNQKGGVGKTTSTVNLGIGLARQGYKVLLVDAMKRQGVRTDLTLSPLGTKLERSDAELAKAVGESRNQIQRYIRLTNLIPEILEMVDEKRIALRPAVEISYLTKEEQEKLFDAMGYEDATPTLSQAIYMKKLSQEGKLTPSAIEFIVGDTESRGKPKQEFRDKRIQDLIPSYVPRDEESDYVVKALQYYNRYLERRQSRDPR